MKDLNDMETTRMGTIFYSVIFAVILCGMGFGFYSFLVLTNIFLVFTSLMSTIVLIFFWGIDFEMFWKRTRPNSKSVGQENKNG